MKRSFFSVVMLALVLAFLYVPILLVFVYAFVPNGLTMSFVGEGLPQYLEESDPGASAEFADASARQEWRTYSKQYRDDFSPQEQAWLASVPKDADGKSAAYDETIRPGEIRLARLGNLKIDVLGMGAQLVNLLVGDVQPKLLFRLGERNPQLAPCPELHAVGKQCLHLCACVSRAKRRNVFFSVLLHRYSRKNSKAPRSGVPKRFYLS